jgi:type IV pilus assembly protein PilA
MKSLQKGFTLIELMIVVAIIGILAAVALPAYQDYTIRAKVTELMLVASGFRTSITEKYQTDGTLLSAGSGLTVTLAGKLAGGSVSNNGIIIVAGSATGTSVGTIVTITLTPSVSGGTLVWSCAGSPQKYLPSSCR